MFGELELKYFEKNKIGLAPQYVLVIFIILCLKKIKYICSTPPHDSPPLCFANRPTVQQYFSHIL